MSNFFGGFTVSGTGVQTYSGVGFQGTEIEFYIGSKSGSSTTLDQLCIGSVDSTGYTQAKSWFRDSTGFKYIESTSKCISVWERSGGVITEVLNATWHSWTADGFKLTVTTANANYLVEARIRDS